MSRAPFVSIVIPVRNREKQIGACLGSLMALDYPDYEVIVVDDRSDDGSRRACAAFPVRVIAAERANQYAARNAGIGKAKGEIVAFIDSDCIARRDWLKNLVRRYEDERTAGVGGKLESHPPGNPIEQFLGLGTLDFQTPQAGWIMKKKGRFMSGLAGSANLSFRKDVLDRLDGFDESYPACGDYDLCRRAQELGFRLAYEPAAIVQHRHRSDLPGMIGQFFRYGCGQALLFKKHNQGASYVRIKPYVFAAFEKEFAAGGTPVYLSIDFVNLGFLLLLLALANRSFLKWGLLLFAVPLAGALARSIPVARKTGSAKWLILYPAFHLLRNAAFSLGRIAGAIRYRTFFS